jgi:hypothetical protein
MKTLSLLDLLGSRLWVFRVKDERQIGMVDMLAGIVV